MTGSRASVSSRPDHVLVSGVNWIGDSVMSMPAIQAYAEAYPETRIDILVKPALTALWELHPAITDVLRLQPGFGGAWSASRQIRGRGIDRVYVLPHSVRSALPAFLARAPERIGMPGHMRDFLLTRVIQPRTTPERMHQQFEYADLLLPGAEGPLPAPAMRVPIPAHDEAALLLTDSVSWIGLIPGAAHGSSKQWPAEHFIEVGERWTASTGHGVAVIGAADEDALCQQVVDGIEGHAINLAGRLSFAAWAAVLQRCAVVVANDSGGMHLAAGLGTPVVALFGHTDPARTGPLGPARVLQNSSVRNRDIARESVDARLSLASIAPGAVYDAVRDLLQAG